MCFIKYLQNICEMFYAKQNKNFLDAFFKYTKA